MKIKTLRALPERENMRNSISFSAWGLLLLLALGLSHPAWGSPKVGQAAPALTVTKLDGQIFDLSALRGKVVVVNFWATWCPPCRVELPEMDKFYREYQGRGVVIIALSIERSRDRGDVRKAMQPFAFPAAMLCDAKANGFGEANSIPDTYVIDKNGVLRATFIAGKPTVTEKSLSDAVLPLLSAQ